MNEAWAFEDRHSETRGGATLDADRTPVSEIMTTHVVCVQADLGVDTLTALFLERNISGAPVVDEADRPIGMVSKTDLVRDRYERGDTMEVERLVLRQDGREMRLDPWFHDDTSATMSVGDIMMPIAFCLAASDSIARAAALMAFEGVHRVPVVGARGEVVGLVSPLDVLRWLARQHGYVVGNRGR